MIGLLLAAMVDMSPPFLTSTHRDLPSAYRSDPKGWCRRAEETAYIWGISKIVIATPKVTMTCEAGKEPVETPTSPPPKSKGGHWEAYEIDPGMTPRIDMESGCEPGESPGMISGLRCVPNGPDPELPE